MSRRNPERRCAWLVAAACMSTALASGCPDSPPRDTLADVRARGVLRWGGDVQGGEPYAFEDPRDPGKLIGFEVELADALAHELGVRAEFVQNDWSNLVPSLERKTFDVALNGLEVTPSRASRVRFSRPYFLFVERLMVRADDTRTASLAGLRGKRVGTLANSMAWDMLQRAGAIAVPYEGVSEPYIDLERGRTDAVLMDDLIADRYGKPRQTLRSAGDLAEGAYAIAMRPEDEELAKAVDDALLRIARDGRLRRILARWNLDSPRQARLEDERAFATPTRSTVTQASAPPFTAHHAWLFVQGAGVTLLVSTLAMLLAIPLGMLLAIARRTAPLPVAAFASAYVEVFRGTPVLLQLYVLYYGLASVVRIDALAAAVLGLGLNYAAYEAEVYRAGIQAVPPGQMEAARALGMSPWLAWRRVLIPQAFRIALPGVTNDFIALLKDSSLVSVITVVELTKQMTITAVDVRSWLLPGALCAALYFAMSYPLSILSRRLEARLAG